MCHDSRRAELPGLITLKWPMRFVHSAEEWAKWTLWLFGFVRPDLVDRLRFSSLCRFVQSFHGYALRTQRQPATNCPPLSNYNGTTVTEVNATWQ